MNRREFLSFFRGAPLAIFPTLAASGLALVRSNEAAATLEKISMTKDGVVFQGCSFKIGGNMQLVGSYQTVHSCSFHTAAPAAAITINSSYTNGIGARP